MEDTNMTREEYLAWRERLNAYQGRKNVPLEELENITDKIREGEGQGHSKKGKSAKKGGWG